MDRKMILNKMELAYAPISGFEFAHLKNDYQIEIALEESSLYVIAQRPILTFENVVPNNITNTLHFEIHQKGNPTHLTCRIPFIQKGLGTTTKDTILLSVNSLNKDTFKPELPLNNLYGFSILQQIKGENKSIIWLSPEKFLYSFWNRIIGCDVEGDIRGFLNYKVHYIGKATKQGILKRLTGHSTFQDILSLESPITYKDLPAHEISILCFKFNDNVHFQIFGDDAKASDMASALMGDTYPGDERIFLDAEKALIKAMEPKYNKELFKGYPKSKDGLYKDKYDYISYSFVDPITLVYGASEIRGKQDIEGGDSIVIKDNKEVSVVRG